ncbi:hypothetical protein [Herminiimonas sp.]|uniref:hypothetical protein n=1 Tax=Herminiimonas sp. TaxID=1926289 RepID=UPI0027162BCF|nr:hypothetical protein [Herminiimonas sp.]MDO8306412.1 hypothetical protein [Herminiimonas sp.]
MGAQELVTQAGVSQQMAWAICCAAVAPMQGALLAKLRALNRHTLLAYDWLMSSQTIESEAIGEWGRNSESKSNKDLLREL